MGNKAKDFDETYMTVDIPTPDGDIMTFKVITIVSAGGKDYIALLPLSEDEEPEAWLFEYRENLDDPNEEPQLIPIEDDDEFEIAYDAFDEWLDNQAFDNM